MKLTYKFTLALLLVSLIAIGLAAVFIWGRSTYEFNRYLEGQRENDFMIAVTTYFQANNSWNGVDAYLRQQGLLPPLLEADPPPQPFVLVDLNREVLVASAPYLVGDKVRKGDIEKGIPIEVKGQTVGTVISTGQPLIRKPIDQKFADQIQQSLWLAGLGGVVVALILGSVVARSLTRPIREITDATRALAQGKLKNEVTVHTNDELGELAQSFNQMSADLARANQSRRQMTADIAHDLRNPLTVIGGYLESLLDGKLSPTKERYETMQVEVRHLQHLVDDLRTLSLTDAGELSLYRQPVSLQDLLENALLAYRLQAEQQGITIISEIEPGLPEVLLDRERMEQVLGNLISNALRYTAVDGEIRLMARQAEGRLVLVVRDNGAGIPANVLPYVFDRFYRGDPSRTGSESGLGLAISRSIVEMHGGTIRVDSQPGQGCQFTIDIPMKT